MVETGVVISGGNPHYWHLPNGRSGGYLPDSRQLWDVLWELSSSNALDGFAHTHPGSGEPFPSYTDLTTFEAVEAGLGRRVDWWISSSNRTIVIRWNPQLNAYEITPCIKEPNWVRELRILSGISTEMSKVQ